MKKKYYLYYFVFFLLGVSLQSLFYLSLNKSDAVEIVCGSGFEGEASIVSIEGVMQSLLVKIDLLSKTVNDLSINANTQQNKLNENVVDNDDVSSLILSQEVIYTLKDELYSNLSNVNYKLPDILGSKEIALLPDYERKAFLDEVARRIDSGEILKSQFLPGYHGDE